MTVFWQRYVDLCLKYGETPNSAAKKMGISSGAVTNWKKGAVPQSTKIKLIADFFCVRPTYFFSDEPEKERFAQEYVFSSPDKDYNRTKLLSLFDKLSEIEQLKLLLNISDYISSKKYNPDQPYSKLGPDVMDNDDN